jgi:hypothetical protein
MSKLDRIRRLLALLALVISLGGLAPPQVAQAEAGYPDFYGTVVAADQQRGTVTLLTDTDGAVTVDVRDLGAGPFNEGAFLIDNVVILRTKREGDRFVAIGWEQARNGRERFSGR